MPVSAALDGHSHPALFLLHTPIAMGDNGDAHPALRFCSSVACLSALGRQITVGQDVQYGPFIHRLGIE